jgi:fatty-acyl-CoA synthase
VIGATHELLGETPVAFVSLTRSTNGHESTLLQFCRERLAEYKVPSRVVVMQELPKSDAGKVDKRALSAFVAPAGVGEDRT